MIEGQDGQSAQSVVAAGGWCAPSETIYEIATGMNTRERMLWRGEVEPTQEEITAEIDRMMAEYLDELKAWDETQVFLRRVEHAHIDHGLPARILALHKRSGSVPKWCNECEYDEHPVLWPCPTARLALTMYLEPRFIPAEPRYEEPVKPVRDESNPRWPFPAGPVEEFPFPEVQAIRGGLRFPFSTHVVNPPGPSPDTATIRLPYGSQ